MANDKVSHELRHAGLKLDQLFMPTGANSTVLANGVSSTHKSYP